MRSSSSGAANTDAVASPYILCFPDMPGPKSKELHLHFVDDDQAVAVISEMLSDRRLILRHADRVVYTWGAPELA